MNRPQLMRKAAQITRYTERISSLMLEIRECGEEWAEDVYSALYFNELGAIVDAAEIVRSELQLQKKS